MIQCRFAIVAVLTMAFCACGSTEVPGDVAGVPGDGPPAAADGPVVGSDAPAVGADAPVPVADASGQYTIGQNITGGDCGKIPAYTADAAIVQTGSALVMQLTLTSTGGRYDYEGTIEADGSFQAVLTAWPPEDGKLSATVSGSIVDGSITASETEILPTCTVEIAWSGARR